MNIRQKIRYWNKLKILVNDTLDLWNAIRFACKTEGIKLSSSKQLLLARGIIAYYNTQPNPPRPKESDHD